MIYVVMTTYVPSGAGVWHPRAKCAVRVARALTQHLSSPEPLSFIIANDGDAQQPHVGWLLEALLRRMSVQVVCGPRGGVGASLNRALKIVGDDDLWMYTTDDWLLTAPYRLHQAVGLIRSVTYDYVRLGPPHPNLQCYTRFQEGLGWWFDINPTAGGYAFATRPFVASPRFCHAVGPFLENADAYAVERDYSDRVWELLPALKMAEVVCGSLEGPWEHIGEFEVGDRFP